MFYTRLVIQQCFLLSYHEEVPSVFPIEDGGRGEKEENQELQAVTFIQTLCAGIFYQMSKSRRANGLSFEKHVTINVGRDFVQHL